MELTKDRRGIVKMYRLAIIGLALILVAINIFCEQGIAFADDRTKLWVSKVISIQGILTVKRAGRPGWQPIKLNDALYASDRIRVGTESRAGIRLNNDAVLRLDQNTTLVFTEIERETTFIFELLRGAAHFFSRRPRSLKILTPFVNGVIEGTEFYVRVDEYQTRIDLFEGRIRAINQYGELLLTKGQSALTTAGGAPKYQVLVKPGDSVQWSLYYPPVLVLASDNIPDVLKESINAFRKGRSNDAMDKLEQTPDEERDSNFYAFRAALLLHLGRVSQAHDD